MSFTLDDNFVFDHGEGGVVRDLALGDATLVHDTLNFSRVHTLDDDYDFANVESFVDCADSKVHLRIHSDTDTFFDEVVNVKRNTLGPIETFHIPNTNLILEFNVESDEIDYYVLTNLRIKD